MGLEDPSGGFYGGTDGFGRILREEPRGTILNARILWAFSASFRTLGNLDYLDVATRAYDWFVSHFIDPEHGGVYWSVSPSGEPLETKKQLYSQGFAIYGLSEYALACADAGRDSDYSGTCADAGRASDCSGTCTDAGRASDCSGTCADAGRDSDYSGTCADAGRDSDYSDTCADAGRREAALRSLREAVSLFECVEAHFADADYGGYTEALARDFSPLSDMSLSAHDINADKTMNSHLHLLEAYATLLRALTALQDVSGPYVSAQTIDIVRERVEALLEIVTGKVMGPDGHLRLYFNQDWSVIPGAVSYGHDIETSWLALECAQAVDASRGRCSAGNGSRGCGSGGCGSKGDVSPGGGPSSLAAGSSSPGAGPSSLAAGSAVSRVLPAALAMGLAGNEGLAPDGSMYYELLPSGKLDDSRQWWVQAEAVVGNLWLWKHHGLDDGLQNALAAWQFIRSNLVDKTHGEWFWGLDPAAAPGPAPVGPDPDTKAPDVGPAPEAAGLVPETKAPAAGPAPETAGLIPDTKSPKAGFWKCPYHNTRMCLEALKILRSI